MRCFFVLFFCLLPVSAFAASQTPLQVYVSVPPQRYLVERIGGDHVNVGVMLSPGQTPETFDPSMRQLESLSEARLYFLAGVPFESAWVDTIRRTAPELRIIDCCNAILKTPGRDLDPHVWTSPSNAIGMARLMLEALVEEDPGRRSEYTANYEQLRAGLSELDDRARERFSSRRTDYFITIHSSWGHLAKDYGLKELSMENKGREIGAKRMAQLVRTARREEIRTVFIQPNHKTPVAQTLADQLGAKLDVLDPLAEDYIANINVVVDRIAGAIR